MGGSAPDTTNTIRYADYIEFHHHTFLNIVETYRNAILTPPGHGSPYASYPNIVIEDAFFGAGYVLASFPSLYDMYGKFMAGLDVEVLFDQAFQDTINGPVVDNLISAEADMLSDDIENEAIPRFEAGMRDINSVMSSSFVIGKAMLEVGRTKALSRFSADVRGRLLPIVVERWRSHLDWNKATIEVYAQILKFFFLTKIDTDTHNIEMHAKDGLWPFTILEFERAAVGVLQGAMTSTQHTQRPPGWQGALGGAMQGAAAGSMFGPWGAAAGGIAGGIGGYFAR